MITDVMQAGLPFPGPEERSPGALEVVDQLSRQLDDLHAAVLELHRPRTVAGGQVRCTECATYVNGALRRMDWPCRTARVLGVST